MPAMQRRADLSSEAHARVFGSPGERPRLTGLVRTAWPLLAVAAAGGYLLRCVAPRPDITLPVAGFLLVALAAGLAAALRAGRVRLASYVKGAKGEESVARELALLPSGFTVFHGVTLERLSGARQEGDLDHVVVGPTGVFVIETKNWSGVIGVRDGRVLYNGREPFRPPLDQVKAGASSLRRALAAACRREVHVQPVLCFAANSVEGGVGGAAGVVLCNARSLNRALAESAESGLPAELGVQIVECLRAMPD
jgi:hypothetical protein